MPSFGAFHQLCVNNGVFSVLEPDILPLPITLSQHVCAITTYLDIYHLIISLYYVRITGKILIEPASAARQAALPKLVFSIPWTM